MFKLSEKEGVVKQSCIKYIKYSHLIRFGDVAQDMIFHSAQSLGIVKGKSENGKQNAFRNQILFYSGKKKE